MRYCTYMDSPIGTLSLREENEALTELLFGHVVFPDTAEQETPLLCRTKQELTEYFAGKRREFSIPVSLHGTAFQKACWEALLEIPFGETRSYLDIAVRISSPKACRAVGMANHHNPVSIIVPCHRVVGKNGSLTGYGGGLEAKDFLLRLEQKR